MSHVHTSVTGRPSCRSAEQPLCGGELGAVHLRHDHVAQDEVYGAVASPDQVQRLGAVAGFDDRVPPIGELAAEQGPHAFLVVDDEDDADARVVGHERLRVRAWNRAPATTEGVSAISYSRRGSPLEPVRRAPEPLKRCGLGRDSHRWLTAAGLTPWWAAGGGVLKLL